MRESSRGISLEKLPVFNPSPWCLLLLLPTTAPGRCQPPAASPSCSHHLSWQEGSRCAETLVAQRTPGTSSGRLCQEPVGGCRRTGHSGRPTSTRARRLRNAPAGAGTSLETLALRTSPTLGSQAQPQVGAGAQLVSPHPPAKFPDLSAPCLPLEVYLGTFTKEQLLPRASGMAGACVHTDRAAQEGQPRGFTGGRGRQMTRDVSGKANETAPYILRKTFKFS